MPFTYEDTLQGERRNALTIPSATGDVLAAQFQQSYEENPILALKRFSDLAEDQVTGPRVSAEDARLVLRESGMENDLTVSDAGITRAALNTLIERKRVEKRRQEVFARSQGGFGEGATRFGVAVGATLSDPLSLGLNFVPVVGQVRYARWLNTARSMGGRLAVRAGAGVIEGTAGAAIAEVPIYSMRTQEQADYDMADSLLNVAFGGVIGAGLHTTVGSVGELISRRLPSRTVAPRVEPTIGETPARVAEPLPADIQRAIFDLGDAQRAVENMSPDAQQAALRAAVGQAVEGRAIDVEPIIRAANGPEVPRLHETLSSTTRETSFGNQPDPVAQEILRSGDVPKLEEALARHGIRETKPLAGGVSSLVLDAGDRVVRIGLGAATPRPKIPEVLQAEASGMAGKIGYEILPKAETVGMGESDVLAMSDALRTRGFRFSDAGTDNLGRVGGRTVVLDSGAVSPEFRAATEHAEEVLAREIEPTAEANLKAAEEEADLAVADVTEISKRLGVDMKADADFAAVMEGVGKAERWARVAELATVCLVRGG